MKTKKRWLKSVLDEAAKTEVELPWTRGAQRAAFKARRTLTATDHTALRA